MWIQLNGRFNTYGPRPGGPMSSRGRPCEPENIQPYDFLCFPELRGNTYTMEAP